LPCKTVLCCKPINLYTLRVSLKPRKKNHCAANLSLSQVNPYVCLISFCSVSPQFLLRIPIPK
jgi:hypothetical protein